MLPMPMLSASLIWAILASLSLAMPELIQNLLILENFSKVILSLRFWVGSTMILRTLDQFGSKTQTWYTLAVRSLVIALIFTLVSTKILHFYFWFEVTLVPTLLLIYGWGYQPERMQASMYFLLYTIFGRLPFLAAVGLRDHLKEILLYTTPILKFLKSPLVLVATIGVFLIKLPIYPLHLWLPKAHVEAPLAGSMALAGVLLKLGVLGIIILSRKICYPSTTRLVMIRTAMWGGVVTSLISLRQTDIKSLIAYSSIGHIGFVIAAIFSQTLWGIKGAILIALAHGLRSPALLNLANIAYNKRFSRSVIISKGLIRIYPVSYAFLLIACAANISAPPFLNLIGELLISTRVISLSVGFAVPISLICFFVGAYRLYLFTSISHGTPSSISRPLPLYYSIDYSTLIFNLFPLIPLSAALILLL